MKRPKRKFSDEQKRAAVDEYVSGRKTAAEVSASLNVTQGLIYKWRVSLDEQAKGARVEELESGGTSPEQSRRIMGTSSLCPTFSSVVSFAILVS